MASSIFLASRILFVRHLCCNLLFSNRLCYIYRSSGSRRKTLANSVCSNDQLSAELIHTLPTPSKAGFGRSSNSTSIAQGKRSNRHETEQRLLQPHPVLPRPGSP